MYKLLITLFLFVETSIYTLSFSDIDGTSISMSSYRGKKLLLVNIATASRNADQLAELEQLQQQFKDRLVVIAFPSNSFAHESKSNAEIKKFCKTNYNATFKIAGKSSVAGSTSHPIFSWLTSKTKNGVMDGLVSGDFQKYLIDEQGNAVGVFSPSVRPLDSLITDAINAVYQ